MGSQKIMSRSIKKKKYDQKYFQEHREEIYAKHSKYMQEHPEQRKKHIERNLLRRQQNPDVAEKARESNRKWREKHPNRSRKSSDSWKLSTKIEVLTYYGKGKLACIRCGYSDLRALSIDHIKDNGAEERRKDKTASTGTWFYSRLRRRGYPQGYQTLCMNCQFIKKAEYLDKLKKGVGKDVET